MMNMGQMHVIFEMVVVDKVNRPHTDSTEVGIQCQHLLRHKDNYTLTFVKRQTCIRLIS